MFSKIVLSLGIEFYQTAILYHYILHIFPTAQRIISGYELSQFMIPWRVETPDLSIWIGNGIFVQLSQDSKKHLAFDRVAVVHLDSITFLWQQITAVASEIQMVHLCSEIS